MHDEGFGRTWIGVTHPAATTSAAGRRWPARGTTHVSSDDGRLAGREARPLLQRRERRPDPLRRAGAPRRGRERSAPHRRLARAQQRDPYRRRPQPPRAGGADHRAATGGSSHERCSSGRARSGFRRRAGAAALRGSRVLGYGDSLQRTRAARDRRRAPHQAARGTPQRRQAARLGRRSADHQGRGRAPAGHRRAGASARSCSSSAARSAETTADAGEIGEIGQGETIRVPLMREQVAVDQARRRDRARSWSASARSAATERVSDTAREEKLRVDGDTTNVRAAATTATRRARRR